MMREIRSRALPLLALACVALAATGCGDILGWLGGTYRGPLPRKEGLTGETVILRTVQPQPGERLILDRVRYLEGGDPHNVNRVIRVITADVQAQVDALNLQTGDRLIVSTRFIQIDDAAELREVPDWPGHGYHEYPIGLHSLTAIARAN